MPIRPRLPVAQGLPRPGRATPGKVELRLCRTTLSGVARSGGLVVRGGEACAVAIFPERRSRSETWPPEATPRVQGWESPGRRRHVRAATDLAEIGWPSSSWRSWDRSAVFSAEVILQPVQLVRVQGEVLAAGGHSPGPGLGEPWPPEARSCGHGSDGHAVTSLPLAGRVVRRESGGRAGARAAG
jgi:hypothetical protein